MFYMENENLIQNEYGSCNYCMCKDCAMLYNIYIRQQHRKQGHATDLVKAVIDTITATGYTGDIKVKAEPSEDSISTENLTTFYKKMGLIVIDL